MERHPKFTRLHQATTPSVQFNHVSPTGVEWPQAEPGYIQPSHQWSASGQKDNQLFTESHSTKSKEPAQLKPPYYHSRDVWQTNDQFGSGSVEFGHNTDYGKDSESHYGDHHVDFQAQSWPSVPSEKAYRTESLGVPDLNHGHSNRAKPRHDDWMAKDYRSDYGPERSAVNAYQGYSVSAREAYSVKETENNSHLPAEGISQLGNFYTEQAYVDTNQDFVDTLTQPTFTERPESRGSIPHSPVAAQGGFRYSPQAPHYPAQPIISPGSSHLASQVSYDAAKLGSRTQTASGLAPALMKLYEKYGIAALKLIYLQRTKDLAASQHRQWNNSPLTISQHFKDPAPVSPIPIQVRSPLPGHSHRIQIQGSSIQQHEENSTNRVSHETVQRLQNQSVHGIENSGTSEFRSIEFNSSWPLQNHQASNLSPMPSPMPPSGQHFQNDSPFQPEMAQHHVYLQQADNTINPTPNTGDYYQDSNYPKTPEIRVSHSDLPADGKHYQEEDPISMSPYQESTEKLQPQPAEAPIPSGAMPTTFGLSAMRSHPEYDSFLPPRKKSRYAFEAAERLLASFGKAVSSRAKPKETESTNASAGTLNTPHTYHDKLKAFSIHNQSSGDNNDIGLSDQLAESTAPNEGHLQLDRAETTGSITTTADISCFQKDESNYAENDPISMKELQSALLDFDANPQVGDDLFDFDKNDDIPCDSVENTKAESQSPVKKDIRFLGKGLGKHSKGISSKPQGKDVPSKNEGSTAQKSEQMRGRKPASKYAMGGIVCPRKAITKAWAYRQAKKNLELIPRRMLRPRKAKAECLCSTSSLKLQTHVPGKPTRQSRRRYRVLGQTVRKSGGKYCTHVRENLQNVSMEFAVRKDQKSKLQQVRQKLDALRLNPSPSEINQLESDLILLENLNQRLEFGDKYLALANIVGKDTLNDLSNKLLSHQNVVLSPKLHGGVKDALCPTKNMEGGSKSTCFCNRPWRLPPADENTRKSLNSRNCKCDAGHSFIIYEYNDLAVVPPRAPTGRRQLKPIKPVDKKEENSAVNVVKEQSVNTGKSVFKLPSSVLQGAKPASGHVSIEVAREEGNSVVPEESIGSAHTAPGSSALPDLLKETPHVNPHLESPQHEPMSGELSIRDIPFYKSTLPKKRGKLWHVTSLALSAARAEAERNENPATTSCADLDAHQTDDAQDSAPNQSSESIPSEATITNDIPSSIAKTDADQVAGPSHVVSISMLDSTSSAVIPHLSSVAGNPIQCPVDVLSVSSMALSHSPPGAEVAMVVEVGDDTIAEGPDNITNPDIEPFIPIPSMNSRCDLTSGIYSKTSTTSTLGRSKRGEHSKNERGAHSYIQKQEQTELRRQRGMTKDKDNNVQEGQKKPWLTSAIKQCPQCSYTTRVKSHLNRHVKTHDVQSQLACPHCSKTFCERPRLEAHIQASHTESGAHFECPQCQKVYNSREGLRVHVKRDHQGQHKYVCAVCQKGFQQIHQYEGHVNKHSGSRPFLCATCGKGFRFRNNRNSHEKTCSAPTKKT